MEEKIRQLLSAIIHPETGRDLVSDGFVERIEAGKDKIAVTLHFARVRDPFAAKLRAQAQAAVEQAFPEAEVTVQVATAAAASGDPCAAGSGTSGSAASTGGAKAEGAAGGTDGVAQHSATGEIGHVVAIASGKGGVGKSTVTANLAVALHKMGYSVGVLDADIYGPSQPRMFGVEGYLPEVIHTGGGDLMIPAESQGVKVMSIGFFIKPDDALLWRGAMAINALRQLIHQTQWGRLDFLLVDLPPGTGDIHLSMVSELKIDAAVIVSTPQQVAVADVVRGVELFRNENVNIPLAGVIENMAWFTPEELPYSRYYLFGRGGARRYAESHGVDFLGEIPIMQSIMDGADEGHPAAAVDARVADWYAQIAKKIVDKVVKNEEQTVKK